MKKWLCVLLLSGCASVGHQSADKATITDYGIYQKVKASETLQLPQSNTGVLTVSDSMTLIAKTDHIPAILGVTFGYCYKIPSKECKRSPNHTIDAVSIVNLLQHFQTLPTIICPPDI